MLIQYLLLFHWKYGIFVIKELIGPRIRIEILRFPVYELVSVSDSEPSYRNVQSWNQTQNRVLGIASLRTGIGTGFQDRIVSEPESELKKLELVPYKIESSDPS